MVKSSVLSRADGMYRERKGEETFYGQDQEIVQNDSIGMYNLCSESTGAEGLNTW